MSRKMKLVLRTRTVIEDDAGVTDFVIIKSTNTLSHGVPGNSLSRPKVDQILASKDVAHGHLTIEFLNIS